MRHEIHAHEAIQVHIDGTEFGYMDRVVHTVTDLDASIITIKGVMLRNEPTPFGIGRTHTLKLTHNS
jgi:hypothetical protein